MHIVHPTTAWWQTVRSLAQCSSDNMHVITVFTRQHNVQMNTQVMTQCLPDNTRVTAQFFIWQHTDTTLFTWQQVTEQCSLDNTQFKTQHSLDSTQVMDIVHTGHDTVFTWQAVDHSKLCTWKHMGHDIMFTWQHTGHEHSSLDNKWYGSVHLATHSHDSVYKTTQWWHSVYMKIHRSQHIFHLTHQVMTQCSPDNT